MAPLTQSNFSSEMSASLATADSLQNHIEPASGSFLIVGSGSIAQRHLNNLRALLRNSHISMVRRKGSLTDLQSLKAADRVLPDLDSALQRRYDAAIVASPAPFHVEHALALARAGSHLLVEKPLSDTLEGVDELIAECERNNACLLVGYTLRFERSLQAVKRAVTDGMIGDVLGIQASMGQYLPDWRPAADYRRSVTAQRSLGGGAVLELSHEIDVARWLGGEVESVSASMGKLSNLEIDVEDWADLNLRFCSGAIGSVHLDLLQRVPIRECRIVGQQGCLIWDGLARSARCFRPEEGSWETLWETPANERNVAYIEELKHFLACVSGRTKPFVSGNDGKRALAIAMAAKDSANTGSRIAI